MNLELYDKENKLICKLDDDEKTLGFYGIDNGMRIHVSIFLLSAMLFFIHFAQIYQLINLAYKCDLLHFPGKSPNITGCMC